MIRLGGDITDASTHFAQIGLAAILNEPDSSTPWQSFQSDTKLGNGRSAFSQHLTTNSLPVLPP